MTKRDAAADLAMCEAATPGPWRNDHDQVTKENGVPLFKAFRMRGDFQMRNDTRFITESREALPHWIQRAVEAEAEIERMRKETEAIRYVVDMLDTGDPQQRRARLHLLEVIKRMEKA
ncbi:hypothetical protein G3578_07580 [Brevibacillus sp. SYP-B805]|uniref:hypothetical protein n=1 Tax=Brevibacillus sp. SYP-B805 TaxID=1578199 RepID=UPI0013ECC6F7|nr:hypothetical protein [Brevibacillus sp. SYP-B805]NGQ95044.1 hypothetical protein [Brevibacillus sp. SYP-B805]